MEQPRRPLCKYRKIIKYLDNHGHEVPINSPEAMTQIERFCDCLGPICLSFEKSVNGCVDNKIADILDKLTQLTNKKG